MVTIKANFIALVNNKKVDHEELPDISQLCISAVRAPA